MLLLNLNLSRRRVRVEVVAEWMGLTAPVHHNVLAGVYVRFLRENVSS